jgi:hypothetical protein
MKKIHTLLIMLIHISMFGLYAQAPDSCLIAYYPFNGNANDESGNGYNGTINGATLATDRFNNANSAFHFNGIDNDISTEVIHTWKDQLTVSFWIKPDENLNSTSERENIIGNYWSTFQFYYNNGKLWFELYDVNHGVSFYSILVDLLSTNWYHISLSSGINSPVLVYINGAVSNIGIAPPTFDKKDAKIIIGREESTFFFKGKIDDIRIYECALDSSEIRSLYYESICLQTITVTDTLVINTNIVEFNPIIFLNTIKIFPNPTNDHITIDYGNYSVMGGYSLRITNRAGQVVFANEIDEQQSYVELSTWMDYGIYFVYLLDAQNRILGIKKIVLL